MPSDTGRVFSGGSFIADHSGGNVRRFPRALLPAFQTREKVDLESRVAFVSLSWRICCVMNLNLTSCGDEVLLPRLVTVTLNYAAH